MIDIHTHILPYIDDGSKTMDASLSMLHKEEELGVTDIFLTPHYMKSRNYMSGAQDNQVVYQQLVEEAQKAGIKIRLHLGNEIYYRLESVSDLRNKLVLPLGNTKKVLLEFHPTQEDEDIAEAIHNMKSLGYTPIIAHIERYDYLKMTDYPIIRKMGALIQVNAGSLMGVLGDKAKKLALKLIKMDLVDFIASDIHDLRVNYMMEAYHLVEKKFSKELADKLFHNQRIFG